MKKIGIDIRALTKNSAGIGSYIQGLLWGLSQLEKDTNQYVLYTNTDELDEVYHLSLPEKKFRIKVFQTNELLWYYRVWRDVRREKVDLFYSTHSTLFSFFPGASTALVSHDLSAILFPKMHTKKVKFLAGRRLLTHACKKATFIIVPSLSTQEDIQKYIPDVIEKVHILPDALYLPKESHEVVGHVHNRFSEWNFPFILYLGTLEPRKNLVRLLEVFHKLSETEFPKHKLIIAGKKGWLSEPIFDKVTELNLRDKVIFPGYVTDEERDWLFEYAEVFAYISLYEGFGFPVLRAMAEGLPVLTSNISSLPEITGANYPYLVTPTDNDDITKKFKALLSLTRKERDTLIERNKKRAQKFSWKTNAEGFVRLIS